MNWELESIVELVELSEECAMHELNVFGCIEFEDEPPIEGEFEPRAYLWARLDMLDEELDESGVEDATEWEKFPEWERVAYTLAEYELGWHE